MQNLNKKQHKKALLLTEVFLVFSSLDEWKLCKATIPTSVGLTAKGPTRGMRSRPSLLKKN